MPHAGILAKPQVPERDLVHSSLGSFIFQAQPTLVGPLTAVSVFSGSGLSDLGYEIAGFKFHVQVEAEPLRAAIGKQNFPDSEWLVGPAADVREQLIRSYRSATDQPLDLLVATPPCQGMSSSNPSRGRRKTPMAKSRDQQNSLILEVIPLAKALKPKLIVAENVRQILTLESEYKGKEGRILDFIKEDLRDYYSVFEGIVDVADYGIPQTRKRAVIVGIRRDQHFLKRLTSSFLLPWPKPSHAKKPLPGRQRWIAVRKWMQEIAYQALDAETRDKALGNHPLHFVPHYRDDKYLRVKDIPKYSGRSAYENDVCPSCGHTEVPLEAVTCVECEGLMRNRPYVDDGGKFRLIKGFRSSYRRMLPDEPAPTITTATSHVGSDFKIHPWENRVLSILECSDLQAIPRFFDWSPALESGHKHEVRRAIGECFPPYFTYLHGTVLRELLIGPDFPGHKLARSSVKKSRLLNQMAS